MLVLAPHVYRVTKYDPRDRDQDGVYVGDLEAVSDRGPVEDAYVRAVASFAAECGVDHLAIRRPEYFRDDEVHPDADELPATSLLAQVFGRRLERFHDGAQVSVPEAQRLVRRILRDDLDFSLNLEALDGDRVVMEVVVGWDQYLYVLTDRLCPAAVAAVAADRLFAEPFPEPIALRPGGARSSGVMLTPRPVDDTFWDDVRALVGRLGSAVVVEHGSWLRVHLLRPGSARPSVRPGALLEVWPDTTGDPATVLAAAADDHGVLCWPVDGGPVRSVEFPIAFDLAHAGAIRTMMRWPDAVDTDADPLMSGVTASMDGRYISSWFQ